VRVSICGLNLCNDWFIKKNEITKLKSLLWINFLCPGKSYSLQYLCIPGSDYAQLSTETWKFFHNLYGGGPELVLRQQQSQPSAPNNISLGAKQHSFESLAASKAGSKGRKFSAKSTGADDDCIQSCSPPTQQRLCRANSSNSSSLSPSDDEADKIEVGLWHCRL